MHPVGRQPDLPPANCVYVGDLYAIDVPADPAYI
jgi:hypothetical protein